MHHKIRIYLSLFLYACHFKSSCWLSKQSEISFLLTFQGFTFKEYYEMQKTRRYKGVGAIYTIYKLFLIFLLFVLFTTAKSRRLMQMYVVDKREITLLLCFPPCCLECSISISLLQRFVK